MTTSTHLLRQKRFLPLMVTQFFNAFNDNLYKTAMVLFVVYSIYNSESQEAIFSGAASLIFVAPFVLFSALAGQLADTRDKAAIIRIVKLCEIGWASLGALGLFMVWQGVEVHTAGIPLLLIVLFLASTQSAFLGPIKYAILPQQLKPEEVLSGTGLVEAGTYIAILGGTILAGFVDVQVSLVLVIIIAFMGYYSARFVPDAPPLSDYEMHFPLLEPFAANTKSRVKRWLGYPFVAIADQVVMSARLIKEVKQNRQIWLAIVAISFFWTMGAVLFILFPPLAKNQLLATPEVASLFLVIFSLGIALGSVGINALLKGKVSARFGPVAVVIMGGFLIGAYLVAKAWTPNAAGELLPIEEWIFEPLAVPLSFMLLGVSTAGGMFVVPLYAFLTTHCAKDAASRTIAVNNIVNCICMVLGSALAIGLTAIGLPVVEQLLVAAGMTIVSAWLGWKLYRAEKDAGNELF
ncbi:MFS transporter [Erythrobacter sp. SCSIO 43205]|uniref:MFS transporter n=1 Tax=Erythrobacter sp. SCSIO 43205 TaxID=2779361 RepID=UPI001CA82722|nr:MFS transporter [Erythrobacter sp. SCSIO 43205]UAB76852.1 MFS transporter [Erythrobacter sp. SCSIO 43205]